MEDGSYVTVQLHSTNPECINIDMMLETKKQNNNNNNKNKNNKKKKKNKKKQNT